MNLILQAIKSMFRKVENSISQTSTALGKRIDALTNKVTLVQKSVRNAQTAADNAQTAADNAQTAANANAFHVLNVISISNNIGMVSGHVTLIDGAIYGILSNVTSLSSYAAVLRINATNYSIYARSPDHTELQTTDNIKDTQVKSQRIFNEGVVSLVQYSAAINGFIDITSNNLNSYLTRMKFQSRQDNYSHFLVAEETSSGMGIFSAIGSSKRLILPSSTEDSTKRFEITVDDSGALTTTEVTE